MRKKQVGGANRAPQNFLGKTARGALCAAALLFLCGGGQEAAAQTQNRPAGAPTIWSVVTSTGSTEIHYRPPSDLGMPAATEVRVRFREPGSSSWANTGGANGQLRGNVPTHNILVGGPGGLEKWSHNASGGKITTVAGGNFAVGKTWEIQMAYTNGQTPVAWSPARTFTTGTPRAVQTRTIEAAPGGFLVKWTPNPNGPAATSWKVQYRQGSSGAYTDVDISDASARGHYQSGLTSGQSYQVQVAGVNSNGTGVFAPTPLSIAAGAGEGVEPPTNLRAVALRNNELQLAWDAPASGGTVATYRVRWKSGADAAARTAASWSDAVQVVDARAHTVTGIPETHYYAAQVASIDAFLAANPSGIRWETLEGPPTLPGHPANLTATYNASAQTVALAWDAPSGGGVSTYQVRWRKVSTSFADLAAADWNAPVQVTNRAYTITGVAAGDFYQAQVASITDDLLIHPGFIRWMTQVEGPLRPAGAPRIFSLATNSGHFQEIHYSAPSDLGIPPATEALLRFRRVSDNVYGNANNAAGVARQVNSGTDTVSGPAANYLSTWRHGTSGGYIRTTTDADGAFADGNSWIIQVAYSNGETPVAWSPERTVTTGTPRITATRSVIAAPGGFAVEWTPNQHGPTPTGWKVQYRKVGEGAYTDADISDASARAHRQSGLEAGARYEVQIAGVNTHGTGVVPAAPLRVTAGAGAPVNPPRNLRATQSGNELQVRWDAPAGGGSVSTYQLRWKSGADKAARTSASWSAPVLVEDVSHTITGISNSVFYAVQVASISDFLLENPSQIARQTLEAPDITLPQLPANLRATPSAGELTFAWDAPAAGVAVSTYQVRWKNTAALADLDAAPWNTPAQAEGLQLVTSAIPAGHFYKAQVASITDDLLAHPGFIRWSAEIDGPLRPAGAPSIFSLAVHSGFVEIHYSPPADLGKPEATEVRIRYRDPATGNWGNVGGADGHLRAVSGTNSVDDKSGGLNVWRHAASGGDIHTLGTGNFVAGKTWEIQMAYTNGQTPVNWSVARPVTIGAPRVANTRSITAIPGGFRLNWTANMHGPAATGWRVRYRKVGESADKDNVVNIADAGAVSYAQSGLEAGVRYQAQVLGTNQRGAGVVAVTPLVVTPLAATSSASGGLSAQRGENGVTLNWIAPAGAAGDATYAIRWKKGAGEAALNAASLSDPPVEVDDALTYTIAGIAAGERYEAEVSTGSVRWSVRSAAPALAAVKLPTLYRRSAPYNITMPEAVSPDSSALTYELEDLPGNFGLEYAVQTSIMSGLPNAAAITAGETALVLKVTDSTGFSVSQGFSLRFGEFNMDVDESGAADSRDGMMLARGLLGVSGDALTAGLSAGDGDTAFSKIDAGKIDTSVDMDVDGDSNTDGDDGILIARYMLGLRGAELVDGIGSLQESDASGIEAKIAALPSP